MLDRIFGAHLPGPLQRLGFLPLCPARAIVFTLTYQKFANSFVVAPSPPDLVATVVELARHVVASFPRRLRPKVQLDWATPSGVEHVG